MAQNGYKFCQRDKNHIEIKTEFINLGFSVADTYRLSNFVDLVVGKYGSTWLVEVKSEKGKLTENQMKFFDSWRGSPPLVVKSVQQVREFNDRVETAFDDRYQSK